MQMYIRGEWSAAKSGKTLGIINPATEDVIVDVPYGAREDVHAAVEAAGEAFKTWSKTTAYDRAAILKKVADLIRPHLSNPGRVTAQGYGDAQAIATNETAEGKSKNRRVEVVIQRGG